MLNWRVFRRRVEFAWEAWPRDAGLEPIERRMRLKETAFVDIKGMSSHAHAAVDKKVRGYGKAGQNRTGRGRSV